MNHISQTQLLHHILVETCNYDWLPRHCMFWESFRKWSKFKSSKKFHSRIKYTFLDVWTRYFVWSPTVGANMKLQQSKQQKYWHKLQPFSHLSCPFLYWIKHIYNHQPASVNNPLKLSHAIQRIDKMSDDFFQGARCESQKSVWHGSLISVSMATKICLKHVRCLAWLMLCNTTAGSFSGSDQCNNKVKTPAIS